MGKYFKGKTYVDLKEVLENRDRRRKKIRKKLLIHPEKTVISYKLNIPGPEKINSGLVAIFDRGLKEITEKSRSWLGILRFLKSGRQRLARKP